MASFHVVIKHLMNKGASKPVATFAFGDRGGHEAILMLILRQDPEVCPESQRVSGHDDGDGDGDDDDDDGDDDDDDDDHQYAPHKQCI